MKKSKYPLGEELKAIMGTEQQLSSNEKLIDDFAAAVRSEYANSTPYTRRELDETRAALLAERNTIETYDGLPVSQEPKYTVTNGRLVNRASGKPIPDDEPVFILRAKDRVAVYAIMAYRAQCTGNPEHHDAVDARVGDFLRFKEAHPQRIKSPDTTALKAGEQ